MKISVNIDPLVEFQAELACIKSPIHQEIFKKAASFIPDYFWIIPSSSSGKYHPRRDLGIGGNVYHTKAVFWIGEELLNHPLFAPFDEITKEDIKVALLLHDTLKRGRTDGGHTDPEHPLLVRDILDPNRYEIPDDLSDLITRTWSRICDLIETHMGIWTKNKEGVEILEVPRTKAQKFVHLADFLASRKAIEVDVTAYNTPKKPSWENEIATNGQINFLLDLTERCVSAGLKIDPVTIEENNKRVITKKNASMEIDKLKNLLGSK